ncbi:MAG: asparagine synthase (glutamine-hydrolyzing) [Pyrinomonadaceae bacterium]
MCGIAGVWLKGERADAANAVERATLSLAHRGPDDQGTIRILPTEGDSTIVFGHRRLAIIDLSEAGHQPMCDPETGNWIVFNGEVYNFRELRRELEERGCRFRSDCDTEVILQSYRVWGRRCVERWRGMFAAAVWDNVHQEMFLVRDRLGIKPLYYSYVDGQLLFASESRALLATRLLERKINLAAVDSYFTFGSVQDPLTLIDGVASLPAAHTLTIKSGVATLREYWELPLETANEPRSTTTVTDSIAECLAEAVRLRLISDVPLGVFLSGGIDSSALTMLMRRASPEAVKTFTVGFADEAFDEAQQARRTAERLGVEHHPILLTEDQMLASCDESVKALDQPSIDGVNTFHVARAVRQAGITVALSGLGGDEAFCGYKHFRTVPRMERFARRWAELPFGARQAGAALLTGSRKSDRSLKLRALLLDDYGFAHPYFLARTLFLPAQIGQLFEPEAVSSIQYEAWAERMQLLTERARRFDSVNAISYLELKTYIPNTLLRDADVMSMAHALEVRVPFLDHLLLEKVLRVPGRMKLDAKMPKPLLVRLLPEPLPEEVVNGRKKGFTLPFAVWLRGRLRPVLEEALSNPPSAFEGIINADGVRRVWRSFLAGECSWTRPWALFILFRAIENSLAPQNVSRQVQANVPTASAASSSFQVENPECTLIHG